MRSFLKFFLASLLAIFIFTLIVFFVLAGLVSGLLSPARVVTGSRAVLVLDLSESYMQRTQENPLSTFGVAEEYDVPGVYDLIRMIKTAETDTAVRGIYVKCNRASNGFADCDEIRNALSDFRKTGKFVIAYGDEITQKAYYVSNVADKIYCNPKGGLEWTGFSSEIPFVKGTLQKLEIEPQIFYAGKFKSATEPLREDRMTDANRLQTSELLNRFFNLLLTKTAVARNIDSNQLRKAVNEHLVRYASDALRMNLVDGLKYDDEVKTEIRNRLRIGPTEKINFVPIARYAKTASFRKTGKDKIALIYAEGDIVSGKGDLDEIGEDTYRPLIRNARMDKDVKALVIRVSSGGGNSLVSENLWREITITRREKPVVVSYGDVAASGAYYFTCDADSIFCSPNTITGSIGVFSILPNLQKFFKNKLGITFDGVKTAPDADVLSVTKPLTPTQRQFFQNEVDSIYKDFKTRVSDGRKKPMDFVDSIGQGRVWAGEKALQLGLVDRMGGIQDAVDCAARMAKTTDYRLTEYPEPKSIFARIFGDYRRSMQMKAVREELGPDGFKTYSTLKRLKAMVGVTQARLPFDISFE